MAKKSNLGWTLIHNHKSNKQLGKKLSGNSLQTQHDKLQPSLQSVTEESNLEEFLTTSELAGALCKAEPLNAKIVNPNVYGILITEEEKCALKAAQEKHRQLLSIPRRPLWEGTTPEELECREKESFLQWRHNLSVLQEIENIKLTPYEKNLECWRQLWRVIERSDIIVQIVDCRNPLLFRCEDLEKYVKESGENKMNLILLNKADFLTQHQRESWRDYFSSLEVQAVFFSALQQNWDSKQVNHEQDASCYLDDVDKNTAKVKKCSNDENTNSIPINKNCHMTAATNNNGFINSAEVLSREELIDCFKHFHSARKLKEGMTTVGLVGYPNVGKSSTINTLLQYKKVQVSATPGKTKHFQTLLLDSNLTLCDCPGLVFPNFIASKAEMIINGILPVDQMTDYLSPVSLITSFIPSHILESTYNITLSCFKEDKHADAASLHLAEKLLAVYGYSRGFMTRRGLPDAARSAKYIIKDFLSGKLLFCQAPPSCEQQNYLSYPMSPEKSVSYEKFCPCADILQDTQVSSSQIDKDFFKKVTAQVHQKGGPIKLQTSKQSKKHGNRNKKEKLRRVYAVFDK